MGFRTKAQDKGAVKIHGMDRTLYVSDLDGTLLRRDQTTSDYTNRVINRLTKNGIIFSYATARSVYSSRIVTRGLNAPIPVILYNGAMILDLKTQEVLDSAFFGPDVRPLLDELFAAGIYPTVYAMVDGRERFSNLPAKSSRGTLDFLSSRNDARKRIVETEAELTAGDLFYLTCIEAPEKIGPFYEKYRDAFHCVYQKDIYSGEQWLEIMPKGATKAAAVQRLKVLTGCSRLVVFGDGMNDLEMFGIADEAYATENAVPELKQIATGVIGNNDDDAVAHWLEENAMN